MPKKSIAWLFATMFLFSSAWADEQSDSDDVEVYEVYDLHIEEIVVSDFRRRRIDEIPASVTKLSSVDVRDMAAQHFEDFVNLVPNLNWSGDGHRARYLQIRGVGELEQYQGAPNPSVGFLIDDIDFSGIGTIATMFDIESIEVLRGSQGSRYGANALAGLVYLRSNEPTTWNEGRVQVGVGDDSMWSLGVAFGGSIDEDRDTTFRFSAHKQRSDGFRENTFLNRDDTNGRDETTVRFKLNHRPDNSNFELFAALIYVNADNGYDAFALDNGYTMLSDKPGKDAQESVGASLNIKWLEVGSGSLRSITSLANSEIDFGFDADWGNDDSWDPVLYDYISVSDRERQTISQEFRYENDSFVAGIYALRLEEDLATLNQGEYYDPFYDFADSLDYPFDSKFESTNVAAFGQYNRMFGDASTFSAGLRIERRSIDYLDSDGLTESSSETLWGGEISISHDFSSSTGYVGLSRGYKASGFNLGVVPDEWRRFGDEALWTLETGIKSGSGGEVQFSASVFHMWREDQQVRASFQLVPNDPASFGFATVNVDGGRNYGLEADVSWQASDTVELFASLGLLYGGFPGSVEQFPGLNGRDQAHAPRHTIAAGITWTHPSGFFARFDGSSKDDFYFDVSHNQKSQSFELFNASVGYDNDVWRVAVRARNLTDEYYAVRGFYFGNEPPDFPATLYTRGGDPRHVSLTIERSF